MEGRKIANTKFLTSATLPFIHITDFIYTVNLNKGNRGIKIGIPTYYLGGLDPDVEKLFNNAIAILKSLGAEIKEIVIPELSMSTYSSYVISLLMGLDRNGLPVGMQFIGNHLSEKHLP